jgi:WD40 repeat protein
MRGLLFFVALPIIIALVAVSHGVGQQQSAYLKLPYGPAHPLVSPDGAYALFGSGDGRSQLWLEDTRTHERKMVFEVTLQTLTLAWSPDSTAFIANDRAVSDLEIAYIYDVKRLDRLDLRSRIVAADPRAIRFFEPGQVNVAPVVAPNAKIPTTSHVHAIQWLDAKHVEVQLIGHTAGIRVGQSVQPGDCFDLRYRVSRVGEVQKLSQRVAALDSKACAAMGE